MDKSSLVYLTPMEVDNFRSGEVIQKLQGWELTRQEFENMIVSGQIKIISEDSNK